MLGSRIEELLASEMEANGGHAVITDEAKQRQLLLDDEEEDFMDEGIETHFSILHLNLLDRIDTNR